MWSRARPRQFQVRDIGFAGATENFASARVIRATGGGVRYAITSSSEYHLFFVLAGKATIAVGKDPPRPIVADDAVTLPGNVKVSIMADLEDTEILEVRLPA